MRRAKKSDGKLYWYGIGGALLAESDLSGNIISEFIFFGGMRIARRDVSSGNVYYFLGDRLGNARVVTNSSGTIVEESDYYPFGQERTPIVDNLDNNYKFTQHERDSESGLDHTQYRQLSSAQGRWLSPDPVRGSPAKPQSWNRYSYVANSPVNAFDPSGGEEVVCNPYEYDFINCGGLGDYDDGGAHGGRTVMRPGCYYNWENVLVCMPTTPPTIAPPDTQALTLAAINRALQALNTERCRALFNNNLADPRSVLSDLAGTLPVNGFTSKYGTFSFGLVEADPGMIANAATNRIGDPDFDGGRAVWPVEITINTDPSTPFNTGSAVDRAVTILHELGHAFVLYFNDQNASSIGIDRGPDKTTTSDDNSNLVRDSCF